MYTVPEEFYIRLHHCRPRFKNNIEDVLVYMSSEICGIGSQDDSVFKDKFRSSIKRYPGNSTKATKTIDNWRTEITSLLGLVEYHENGTCSPSQMAQILDENQDLIEFFRYFCFKFQYPGGHLKPRESMELIQLNVKFKPVQYLLSLLRQGTEFSERSFGISKEETTHCIFNDLRVVRDNRCVKETLKLILENRSNKIDYNSAGDTIRYAGDILDYMELANLVTKQPNGKYYGKNYEIEVIQSYIDNKEFFPHYESLYGNPKLNIRMVANTQNDWFRYVNQSLDKEIFKSDVLSILTESKEPSTSTFIVEMIQSLREKESSKRVRTKDIGDTGEAIAMHHEKTRLTSLEREDLAKKVAKIPESLSVGYDINSYEGEAERMRVIEVKTTISKNKLNIQRFHMTPNEWGAADSFGEVYFIYRLMISSENVSLFIIKNPVQQYKNDMLNMAPRNGADISYTEKSGYFEGILT